MSIWRNVVSIEFDPVSRSIYFGGKVILPETDNGEVATERQLHAVKSFYQRDFYDLTYSQAHTLLCYREYARLCTRSVLKRRFNDLEYPISLCLTFIISSDKEISEFTVKWNERDFLRQVYSPRVIGTPFFADMQDFCAFVIMQFEHNKISDRSFLIL